MPEHQLTLQSMWVETTTGRNCFAFHSRQHLHEYLVLQPSLDNTASVGLIVYLVDTQPSEIRFFAHSHLELFDRAVQQERSIIAPPAAYAQLAATAVQQLIQLFV